MFVKNRFCHFRTFPWLLKKICKIKTNLPEIRTALPPPPPPSSTELLPLNMCCNIHHFGITKRRVMASKLQVTLTKLQVTLTKLQVTLTKLQVTLTKLQVTPTKLQVTRSKLTSLTAETNKFQLTNMLFITCCLWL